MKTHLLSRDVDNLSISGDASCYGRAPSSCEEENSEEEAKDDDANSTGTGIPSGGDHTSPSGGGGSVLRGI